MLPTIFVARTYSAANVMHLADEKHTQDRVR